MTRDDYKVKDTMIFEESQEDSINSIIDNIFDDFESRTCENCKHQSEGDSRFFCSKINISFDIGGCGDYWEIIDEK